MAIWLYFIIFAILGMTQEVIWRGLYNAYKEKTRKPYGVSNLWMLPVFGSAIFIVLIVQTYFAAQSWIVRGLIYLILFYCLELISGSIFKFFNVEAWDYSKDRKFCSGKTCIDISSKSRYNFKGLICLDYAPVWFIEGLVAEWLYLFLQTHLII